jgi:hypothetical protein
MEFYTYFFVTPRRIPENSKTDRAVVATTIPPLSLDQSSERGWKKN